jgi:type VI secretion system protein VasG
MTWGGELTYSPALVRAIAEQAGVAESGARTVDEIMTHTLLPALSARILDNLADAKPIAGAHLSIGPDGGLLIEIRA